MSRLRSEWWRSVRGGMTFFRQFINTRVCCKVASNVTYGMIIMICLSGCGQEMENQRRLESQEQTDIFVDGSASQPIPKHAIGASASAVASVSLNQHQANRNWQDSIEADDAGGYLTGKSGGDLVNIVPDQVLLRFDYPKLIQRGRERFQISCVPCHDQTGSGNGMVARRGLKFPPSYHTDRLRHQPLGYIFNVATNGRGQMPAYGDYLSTDDLWAITAYVRTLQFSQYAPASDLTAADLELAEQSEAISIRAAAENRLDGSK
jgi:cytochrome c553